MAFIKKGDEQPICNVYDSDGEEYVCPKCGSKIIIISVNQDDNTPFCESCDDQER